MKKLDGWQRVAYVEREKRLNCRSYYKRCPVSKGVIIFIHGIVEGPKQFRRLAEIGYEEGYSSLILLLPGHGGSGRAFAETDFMQWVVYVSRQIAELKERYEHVILVGHSMGALFALCEAVTRREKIEAIILIDIPLKVHVWPRIIKSVAKILRGNFKSEERYTLAVYRAMSVGKANLWDYIKWLKRYIELLSIIRYARKKVRGLKTRTLVVFAKKDEFVSNASIKYFAETCGRVETLLLEDSGHFAYHHSDLAMLEEAYRRFICDKKEKCR